MTSRFDLPVFGFGQLSPHFWAIAVLPLQVALCLPARSASLTIDGVRFSDEQGERLNRP